jgi:hypothetical protein
LKIYLRSDLFAENNRYYIVLAIVITMHFFTTSRPLFSVKSHWAKTKISGMAELDVVMKFHYRTGLGNSVFFPEGDAKLGENPH